MGETDVYVLLEKKENGTGDAGERDVYGAQQHMPLAELTVKM